MTTIFVDGKLVEVDPTAATELIALRQRIEELDKLYRFYIVNKFNGIIHGTSDNQDAIDYSSSDDHVVIDTKYGKQLLNQRDAEISYLGD
jgi:hypothetical protein